MSAIGINALLIDGPDPHARSLLIDQLATYLQARGVRIKLQLRPNDPDLFSRPGAGYLVAMGHAILGEELVLISGSWLRPGLLGALGQGRARMLQRAAFASNIALVWLGQGMALPSWLPVVRHDPEAGLPSVLEKLAAFKLQPNIGPGAGAWRPRQSLLLVGDRPNSLRHGELKHRLPFVSMHNSGCSLWLAEQLEAAGIPEEALYWINAFDHLDRPTPFDFLAELQPRVIVALGANAARWCQQADVAYHQVAHPQHHKRFHGDEAYALGALLQAALEPELAA